MSAENILILKNILGIYLLENEFPGKYLSRKLILGNIYRLLTIMNCKKMFNFENVFLFCKGKVIFKKFITFFKGIFHLTKRKLNIFQIFMFSCFCLIENIFLKQDKHWKFYQTNGALNYYSSYMVIIINWQQQNHIQTVKRFACAENAISSGIEVYARLTFF